MHPVVGKDVEERRLPELCRQRLLERHIEDLIAGSVYEISNENRVFISQRRRAA
jgi:hypothetical protein